MIRLYTVHEHLPLTHRIMKTPYISICFRTELLLAYINSYGHKNYPLDPHRMVVSYKGRNLRFFNTWIPTYIDIDRCSFSPYLTVTIENMLVISFF